MEIIMIILVAIVICLALNKNNRYTKYEYNDNYAISTDLPLIHISNNDILLTVESATEAFEICSKTNEKRLLFYCEDDGKYLEFDDNKPLFEDKFRYVELDHPLY